MSSVQTDSWATGWSFVCFQSRRPPALQGDKGRLRRLLDVLFASLPSPSRCIVMLRMGSGNQRRRNRQPRDAVKDGCEQPPRHRHFGKLERHVFRVLVQVRHDETDAREQLSRVSLDLGDHATRSLPRLRLILEAVIEDLGLVWRATHRTRQKVLDFPLQHGVGLKATHVAITFFLQHSIQRRIGKRRIAAKELGDIQVGIPLDHWQSPASVVTLLPRNFSFRRRSN